MGIRSNRPMIDERARSQMRKDMTTEGLRQDNLSLFLSRHDYLEKGGGIQEIVQTRYRAYQRCVSVRMLLRLSYKGRCYV